MKIHKEMSIKESEKGAHQARATIYVNWFIFDKTLCPILRENHQRKLGLLET